MEMRVLGVNATSSTLWLACADADGLLDIGEDYQLQLPKALETGQALVRARDDFARIIRRYKVRRVRLLSAEATYKAGYGQFVPRITMETVVAFAAAAEDVDFLRLSRPTVRSRLDLPKAGSLESHSACLGQTQSPHWKKKRDLAAMVAVAGVRAGDGDE